jgi:rhodanese-related sulfurtransferase
MLKRLVNLPFSIAARAFQEREDAKIREKYGPTRDPGDVPVTDRVGNGNELTGVDPQSCRMDAADAVRAARGTRPVAFVDVRVEPRAGIAGAIHMPLAEANMRVSELPPDQLVVVFCDDGTLSARAASFFRERGMEDTFWIGGGLGAFRAAGGRTEAA